MAILVDYKQTARQRELPLNLALYTMERVTQHSVGSTIPQVSPGSKQQCALLE